MNRSRLLRIVLYPLAFAVPIMALSTITMRAATTKLYSPPPTFEGEFSAPGYDPNRPTVAVLLGGAGTEVTDFLVPYELFSRSKRFNVYAVAPERKLSPLTGGLDVVPQYGYRGLERLLSGSPDVIVVPAMVDPESEANRPVISWLKANVGPNTLVLGICSGAAVLAEAGLLDGQTATAHWAALDGWARQYPKVTWVRGQRYVDEGNLITTAGLTSGIDGVLHVLDRLVGRATAVQVATEVHYEGLPFLDKPVYPARRVEQADGIYPFNEAFRLFKPDLGVLLYNGMAELPLASVMDTYAGSLSATLHTLAAEREITSKHGLTFHPRLGLTDAPRLERLLVPGTGSLSTKVTAWVRERGVEVAQPHRSGVAASQFAFDAPVQDLARRANLPIAHFAAKRLELLDVGLSQTGRGWPLHLLFLPLSLGVVGVGLAAILDRLSKFRRTRRDASYL